MHRYDVVILGAGIAGLSCAADLAERGLKVAVLTKTDRVDETNTYYAQGGIIAGHPGDTADLLAEDVLAAGNHYNNREAVSFFAQRGPAMVHDFLIDRVRVPFCRDDDGEYDYTGEAAHSIKRILHHKDFTGEAIQKALSVYVNREGVDFFPGYTAVDLMTNHHHSRDSQEKYRDREVLGVYALNNAEGTVESFFSSSVVLATGGLGALYYYSTNPESATGDGISMAFRAGAEIINAEFVQFHPTTFYHREIKRFLISESLRGEGAVLKDGSGRAFMEEYSPQGDLAPRDVVSRAIFDRMAETGADCMFLDLATHYDGRVPIRDRFSKIYETCLRGGIDISREPIPVVPAAHYFCGGVKADLQGRTSLKNLYAVGEVSCTGLHGANRLASTSLLEGLLWGRSTAEAIAGAFCEASPSRWDQIPEWKIPSQTEDFDPLMLKQDMQAIQLTMWNYAGIHRTRKGLARAKSDLNYYRHRILKFYGSAVLNPSIIELRNAAVSSAIIVNAALKNSSSIGCHCIR